MRDAPHNTGLSKLSGANDDDVVPRDESKWRTAQVFVKMTFDGDDD